MTFALKDLGLQAPFDLPPDQAEPSPDEPPRYPITRIGDLILHTANTWLIKGILPASGFGLLFGPSGSGKSFAALDLAAHIVTSAPWNGLRVRQAGVLYVGLEGAVDVRHRLIALRDAHGLSSDAPLGLITDALDLTDDRDGESLTKRVASAAETLSRPVGLIIIDTLARAAGGANENDASEMTALVNAAEEIGRAAGALVLLVHHSPWDAKRPRGSTALYAACDVILEVSSGGDDRSLQVRKNKAGREGEAWAFDLEIVELGRDEDGDPITSCVVAWRGEKAPTPRRRTVGASAERHLQALRIALDQRGRETPGFSGRTDTVRSVSVDEWRDVCERRSACASDKPDSRRRAFDRAMNDLRKSPEIIGIENDRVWLIHDPPDTRTCPDTSRTCPGGDPDGHGHTP